MSLTKLLSDEAKERLVAPKVRMYRRKPGGTSADLATSLVIAASVWALLAAVEPELFHVMALPVILCGGLSGVEATQWLQRQRDTLDSAALLSIFLVHFFFLAPILHIVLDWWAPYLKGLDDWRPAIARMALLNAVGLIGLRWVWNRPAHQVQTRIFWAASRGFRPTWVILIAISLIAQVLSIARFGSPLGVIEAFESGADEFAGSGWILVLSEALPYLLLIGFCESLRRRNTALSTPALAFLLLSFICTTFLLAGLRGSRANIIWAGLIGLMVIHSRLRRVRRREVVALAVCGLAFMYVYGFYKSAGTEGFAAVIDRSKQVELEETTGRDLRTVILGDLARADIQALALARIEEESGYRLRLGSTYVAGALSLVPDRLLVLQIDDKTDAGTALLYEQSESLGDFRISNIYGLAGEAMLNFGPVAAPFAVFLYGVFSRWVLLGISNLRHGDTRQYFAPIGLVLLVLSLGSDLDNTIYGFIKFGLLPAVLIVLASSRVNLLSSQRGDTDGADEKMLWR